jgi:hypothetical protein
VDAPTFLAPDRTGRYMLCAYYQGGYVAVYPIAAGGTIDAAPIDKQETAVGAHAIATDPSNRFAFVPHIARIQDNVLEPPKNNPGPNVILQYRFNAQTGRLSPNTPHRVEQGDLIGPRHYIHHPSLDVVYFSNEQGCTVTAYRLDGANGTLSSVQTTTTLPAGHSERTTCSQIHLTPSGRLLYVGNRAVNGSSIAAFAIDPETGHLTAAGQQVLLFPLDASSTQLSRASPAMKNGARRCRRWAIILTQRGRHSLAMLDARAQPHIVSSSVALTAPMQRREEHRSWSFHRAGAASVARSATKSQGSGCCASISCSSGSICRTRRWRRRFATQSVGIIHDADECHAP